MVVAGCQAVPPPPAGWLNGTNGSTPCGWLAQRCYPLSAGGLDSDLLQFGCPTVRPLTLFRSSDAILSAGSASGVACPSGRHCSANCATPIRLTPRSMRLPRHAGSTAPTDFRGFVCICTALARTCVDQHCSALTCMGLCGSAGVCLGSARLARINVDLHEPARAMLLTPPTRYFCADLHRCGRAPFAIRDPCGPARSCTGLRGHPWASTDLRCADLRRSARVCAEMRGLPWTTSARRNTKETCTTT